MKIYTKKGDFGETALYGGTKTDKNNQRIHAYGTVDELNSAIGMVLAEELTGEGKTILNLIQNELFVVGSDLATPDPEKARIDQTGDMQIEKLENFIDELEKDLPPLKSFILPGGTRAGAALHFCRTVCRRAERETVTLSQEEKINPKNIVYLNRLSDLLFVLARYENHKQGATETPWTPELRKKK